jgi:tRNA nucleotidyltransferase (CCA-adding enzyme)
MDGMNIIVGHTNMDLDCFGSMVLARYLYPEHRLIRSRLIHPVAKNLYNLYQNHLDLLPSKELKQQHIENMVVVDTRKRGRIKEYFSLIEGEPDYITIYDHHSEEQTDLAGAELINRKVAANTTLLGKKLLERGIPIEPEDATIALAGIYADTGNFTHENVTADDFAVAEYLVEQNASIKLVKKFLQTLKDEHQITLFHELLNRLFYADFGGHFIILSFMEMEKQAGGLAAVVEKVFEVEDSDAIFSVFGFRKENDSIIIARSQKETINVKSLLTPFEGGGHLHAASALVKDIEGETLFSKLQNHLQGALLPARTVKEIMTKNVAAVNENWSLMQASMFLENINHAGAPVVDNNECITGFMTLKDIMKGRKSNQMHSPVKAYMTRKVITVNDNATMRDIEHLLYTNNIGHLPVVENRKIIGILTRSDFRQFVEQQEKEKLPDAIEAVPRPLKVVSR